MIEEKQQLFQTFNTSIDDNHEVEEPQEPQDQQEPLSRKIRGRKRASTFTKLNDNKSLDAAHLQDLKSSMFNSFHMFKKFVSSQEIFYGKTSQQELYQMIFDYMSEIIHNPTKLNKQIKSMNFQNMERHECLIEIDTLKLTPKKSSKLDRIFTQNNITHSVSIEFEHSSAMSSGVKNNSSGRSPSKTEIEEEVICSQFASIEEVESERMQDSIRIIIADEETKIEEMMQEPPLPPPRRNANVSIRMMQYIPNNDSFEDRIKSSESSSNKIRENSIDKKVEENRSGKGKKQASTTSFGFEFDKRMGGNNILQQVSMLYLNNSRSNREKSQVSLSIDGDQSSWLSQSQSEQPTLEDVADRINISLTKQFLMALYYEPEPFLITISLIYFLKYLYHSAHVLSSQSATILLTTSLLVSYKIYEDQPILGLVEYLVEDVLNKKLTREEMIKFERHFLQSIDYEVVIGNEQFYKMLAMIKGQNVEN